MGTHLKTFFSRGKRLWYSIEGLSENVSSTYIPCNGRETYPWVYKTVQCLATPAFYLDIQRITVKQSCVTFPASPDL